MPDVFGAIAQIQGGRAIQEIAAEFDGILESVRQVGGSGELTIKVKVEGKTWDPNTNQLREVGISHSVQSKRPKRKVGSSTFFLTRDGDLTRNSPDQQELFDLTIERKEA